LFLSNPIRNPASDTTPKRTLLAYKKLQFTHSQGVGTHGSPSFFRTLSAYKKRNAFTKFVVK